MGQDFAQWREWSEERSLDWELLDTEKSHRQLNTYFKDLLTLYKSYPAMFEMDCEEGGFRWVYGADASHNMLTICRMTKNMKNCILFHFNFSPVEYRDHRIGCLCPGTYKEIFNSDKEEYGGSNLLNLKAMKAENIPWDWNDYSLKINVPAYGVVALKFDYKDPDEAKKAEAKKKAAKKSTAKKEAVKSVTRKSTTKKASKDKRAKNAKAPQKRTEAFYEKMKK